MKIPELSYPFESNGQICDQNVYRAASGLELGPVILGIEAITMAGSSGKPNQDAFGFTVSDNALTAAVFDGAVSRIASHKARDLFEAIDEPLPARQMLSQTNQGLTEVNLDGGATTGTMVQINHLGDISVAHVCDSWAMALMRDGRTQLLTVDQHEQFDRKALAVMARIAVEQQIELMEARDDPEVRAALTSMFREVRNAPDGNGEGILNGSEHMDQYIRGLEGEEPLHAADVKMLVLGTDGARFPGRNEANPRYRENLMLLIGKHGVAKVTNMIYLDEELNLPTPDHPRWSVHDDKTLITIHFKAAKRQVRHFPKYRATKNKNLHLLAA